MILLDTDTVSLFHAGHAQVIERVAKVDPGEAICTTVITRAEVLRARLSFLLKAEDGDQLQRAQEWLDSSEAFFADLPVVAIDAAAAAEFDKLRKQKSQKKIGRAEFVNCEHCARQSCAVGHPERKALSASPQPPLRKLGGLALAPLCGRIRLS